MHGRGAREVVAILLNVGCCFGIINPKPLKFARRQLGEVSWRGYKADITTFRHHRRAGERGCDQEL
jgi:hypothetical protein